MSDRGAASSFSTWVKVLQNTGEVLIQLRGMHNPGKALKKPMQQGIESDVRAGREPSL